MRPEGVVVVIVTKIPRDFAVAMRLVAGVETPGWVGSTGLMLATETDRIAISFALGKQLPIISFRDSGLSARGRRYRCCSFEPSPHNFNN